MSDYEVDVVEMLGAFVANIQKRGFPDLAFISVSGGQTEGFEVVKAIRAMNGGQHPIILVTLVEANLGHLMRARRSGASGTLLKPFDRAALEACLSTYFEQSAAA